MNLDYQRIINDFAKTNHKVNNIQIVTKALIY